MALSPGRLWILTAVFIGHKSQGGLYPAHIKNVVMIKTEIIHPDLLQALAVWPEVQSSPKEGFHVRAIR